MYNTKNLDCVYKRKETYRNATGAISVPEQHHPAFPLKVVSPEARALLTPANFTFAARSGHNEFVCSA